MLNSFLEEMKTVRFITKCRLDELGVTENIDEETRIEGSIFGILEQHFSEMM